MNVLLWPCAYVFTLTVGYRKTMDLLCNFRYWVLAFCLTPFVLSASAFSADLTLNPDLIDSGEYGWRWGSNSHRDSVVAEFQGTSQDLELSVVGYDIDFPDESSVELNGQLLGYLDTSPSNNSPVSYTHLTLPTKRIV